MSDEQTVDEVIISLADTELLDEIDVQIDGTEIEESGISIELLNRREHEKQQFLAKITTDDHKHLLTRVAHVLNRYQQTRNSDITLMLKYWEVYHSDAYKAGDAVTPDLLYRLERLTSITRARAKIQNEYRLFKGDEEVRRFRKNNEEIEKEIQLSTKPDVPTVSIYCDETGKTRSIQSSVVIGF